MIPIRYNGYAGREFIVGGLLGIVVGSVVYLVGDSPSPDIYSSSYRSIENLAFVIGFSVAWGTAGVMDIVVRIMNAVYREYGVDAAIDPNAGGHIWYIPLWIVGSVVAALMIIFGLGR